MTKLPEGRKPIPNEWFIDRVTQITPMTDEERKRAKEKEKANMTHSHMSDEITLLTAMRKNKLTLEEAVQAMETKANEKQFQKDLDEAYRNMVVDDWEYWSEGDLN